MRRLPNRIDAWLTRGTPLIIASLVILLPIGAGYYVLDQNARERARNEAEKAQERQAAIDAWARYDREFRSCLRSRVNRIQINEMLTEVVQPLAYLLAGFFDSSAILRLQSDRPDLAKLSLQARDRTVRLAERASPIPPVVCKDAVPRPSVPRPPEASPDR